MEKVRKILSQLTEANAEDLEKLSIGDAEELTGGTDVNLGCPTNPSCNPGCTVNPPAPK